MYERILEIIAYILTELKSEKDLNKIDYNILSQFGYSEVEINIAIAWVFSKSEMLNESEHEFGIETGSSRFFNYEEQKLFTPEALGYLIMAKELEIISEDEREMILDRIVMSGYSKIDVNEMKLIITSILLKTSNPKNRLILNNNETIN